MMDFACGATAGLVLILIVVVAISWHRTNSLKAWMSTDRSIGYTTGTDAQKALGRIVALEKRMGDPRQGEQSTINERLYLMECSSADAKVTFGQIAEAATQRRI